MPGRDSCRILNWCVVSARAASAKSGKPAVLVGLDCALKFIPLAARGSQLEERALETMKSIRHPNLVGLFGIWQRDGMLILAMELCDGTLFDRLNEVRAQGPAGIQSKELLKYLRDAACGLDALHARGVQHRDVKPQNLLLMQGGVKVADFGLAKVLEHTATSHTGADGPGMRPRSFSKEPRRGTGSIFVGGDLCASAHRPHAVHWRLP